MKKGSEISLEQFKWLLNHYDELHIKNLDKYIIIKAVCVTKDTEIVPGIVITESIPTSYQLIINGSTKNFQDKDSILRHLRDNGLLSDRLTILDFKDQYWNNTIDSDLDDFNEKLGALIETINFDEMDMNGLLNIYGPISTHFTVYVYISDPNDFNDLFRKEFPDRYENACKEYDLFVKCASSGNYEPFYKHLGIDEISDLIIDTYPHWRGVLTFTEWTLTVSVTPKSLDWLRRFKDDYSMGGFNDLCFYKDEEQLYESISHERERSDLTGMIKKF